MSPCRQALAAALLLAGVVAVGGAEAGAAAAVLELSPSGFPVAPVDLNGRGPFRMIVDTAASSSVLFPRTVKSLELQPSPGARVSIQGASGRRLVDRIVIESVEVAGRRVESLRALVLDDGHLAREDDGVLHGVLGADVLSRFDVVLDFPGGALRLEDSAAPPGAVPWTPLLGRFVTVPARIDGVAVTAVVDTGARRSVVNGAALRALGLRPGDPRLVADEPVRGATADATPAWAFRAGTLEAAGQRWVRPQLGASELPVFEVLGLAERPTLLLGANLLREHELRVDHDERLLRIGAGRPALEEP